MNRILFLDNSIENDLYRPLSYWEPVLLFEFDSYRASAGQLPDDLDAYSHIFISGSTASVLDKSRAGIDPNRRQPGKSHNGQLFRSPDHCAGPVRG
jgi:hypothetical protein